MRLKQALQITNLSLYFCNESFSYKRKVIVMLLKFSMTRISLSLYDIELLVILI